MSLKKDFKEYLKELEENKNESLKEIKSIDSQILESQRAFVYLSTDFKNLAQNSFYVSEDIVGNDLENIQFFIEDFNELHNKIVTNLEESIKLIEKRKILIETIEQTKERIKENQKQLKKLETLKSNTSSQESKSLPESVRSEKNEFDIFIAYHRNSAGDFAEHLYSSLKREGYHPFIDIFDIPNSIVRDTDEWREFRDKALLESKRFFLILTKGCKNSIELKNEIELAFSNIKIRKTIFKNKSLPNDFVLDCGEASINLVKQNYVPFESKESLLRNALDELEK
jgi:hypothetical protein